MPATKSNSKSLTKMKEKKKWSNEALNHPLVKEGLMDLSDNGESFKCLLFDSMLQTKHLYTFFRMTGSGGHESTDTHQRKMQARTISQQYNAKTEVSREISGESKQQKTKINI
eukprot:2646930-Ditylum_brightwellii.AAC.1